MPKTPKGKPVPLSSSNLLKRTSLGMCLNYNHRLITLYNSSTQCSYYSTSYVDTDIATINKFEEWVNNWCAETSEEDIVDIENFAKESRKHVKFKEGDVFRFKIDRRLCGYGRVILDFDKMRKRKEPFWDILMSKGEISAVLLAVLSALIFSIYTILNKKMMKKTYKIFFRSWL